MQLLFRIFCLWLCHFCCKSYKEGSTFIFCRNVREGTINGNLWRLNLFIQTTINLLGRRVKRFLCLGRLVQPEPSLSLLTVLDFCIFLLIFWVGGIHQAHCEGWHGWQILWSQWQKLQKLQQSQNLQNLQQRQQWQGWQVYCELELLTKPGLNDNNNYGNDDD